MLRFLSIVSVAFVLSVAAFAHAENGTVKGRVVDATDYGIANARLFFHRDPTGSVPSANVGAKQDGEVATDKDGNFEMSLPRGIYDVFVSAPAFSPYCKKIRVKRGLELKVKLSVDQVTIKEMD